VETAVRLAAALTGPEDALRTLLTAAADAGGGDLRAAAELIERAAAEPVPVAAELGDEKLRRLRIGERGIERLHRLFRRDDALGALYAADQSRSGLDRSRLSHQAAELAVAVWSEREELDRAIGGAARAWRVERMAAVDRNVLRIALWELRHRPDAPVAVIVSEAVRLAKVYSTAQSGRFVNGVLATLAAEERPAGDGAG
jgi:N utilization substance protein B